MAHLAAGRSARFVPITGSAGGQEGYGLAIVTALAHQHGGSASFYNDNGAVASVALSTE
ncbi:MAG: hypothetical protein ACOCXE_01605 [Spirochaetota bacterium]